MTLAEQVERIHRAKAEALQRERIGRDVAFLHTDRFTVCERIGDFEAVPLTLFHCNILRLAGSPFLPPFAPIDAIQPQELAQFLWVISPEFKPGCGREATAARERFLKRCRKFVKPASAKYRFSFRRVGYVWRAGRRLALFTRLVEDS